MGTAVVVGIAAILRLVRLDQPRGQIFDEVYYAVDARHLLQHGVEWDDATGTGAFVVHPPLGKWLIAVGEWLFGYREWGWRIAPAVAGILAVLIVTRLARRLFHSTVLGCAAGLLMALDGLQLVLSRVALLDIFLLLFVLAAFACLVRDRDGRAGRPPWTVPWWRLAAAVMAGCALAVKWSAVWYLLGFVVLIVGWQAGARRSAGVARPWRTALREERVWVALSGLTVVAVYLASWTGWFATGAGWDRHWLATQGRTEQPVLGALLNLWHYHREALHFHDTLSVPHRYQSWPWQWLLLDRPVLFQWSCPDPCTVTSNTSEVLLLGTPLLWWSFLPALAGLVWLGVRLRDWRAWAIGCGVLAGIVPWFPFELSHRTMFYSYVAPAEPFLILAVVYVLGALPRARVLWAGGYVLAVALTFAYFYPVYVSETLSYSQWWARMWLGARWY